MSAEAGASTILVTVGDSVVRCSLSGVDGGADPVVVVPGLGGESELSFLVPLLARTGRVLAIDLDFAPRELAATLEQLIGQLATALNQVFPARSVTLVGFSVGATVAAAFASTSREVASLVLVSPVLRASNRHRLVAGLRSRLARSDPGALGILDLFVTRSPSFLQAHDPAPTAPDEHAAARHQLFVDTDLSGSVPRITVPALVVGAIHDDLAGIDQARMLFASLPNARYAEVDSAHAVLAERPAEVLALIREFVAHPLRHRAGSVLEGARP
ncbi:alpha/beta fold hydrolase [Lacisediminihabitans sp. FW035]